MRYVYIGLWLLLGSWILGFVLALRIMFRANRRETRKERIMTILYRIEGNRKAVIPYKNEITEKILEEG